MAEDTAEAAVISFCLVDGEGTVLAERGQKRVLYAASTIKLGVAVAVLRRVDAGALALSDTLASANHFASRIPGAPPFGFVPGEIDHEFPAPGEAVSVRECLQRMISASSNEATNLLVELVGLDAVTATFGSLGAPTATMTRLIGDFAARQHGYTHEASAFDLATTMAAITSGRACSPESTALLCLFLSEQVHTVIADVVPPGIERGSKSGWVDGIQHDVIFTGAAGTADHRCLAICTAGLERDRAHEAMRVIASALLYQLAS